MFALLPAAARPNIVLCITDDQTWDHSGAYGHKTVKTPNIDRLARQGMRMTPCFTATAMCARAEPSHPLRATHPCRQLFSGFTRGLCRGVRL